MKNVVIFIGKFFMVTATAVAIVEGGSWLFSEPADLSISAYRHVEFGVPGTVVPFDAAGGNGTPNHLRIDGTENSRIVPVKLDGRSGTYGAYLGFSCGERIPLAGERVTVEVHTLNSDGPVIGWRNGNRPATNAFLECRKPVGHG